MKKILINLLTIILPYTFILWIILSWIGILIYQDYNNFISPLNFFILISTI